MRSFHLTRSLAILRAPLMLNTISHQIHVFHFSADFGTMVLSHVADNSDDVNSWLKPEGIPFFHKKHQHAITLWTQSHVFVFLGVLVKTKYGRFMCWSMLLVDRGGLVWSLLVPVISMSPPVMPDLPRLRLYDLLALTGYLVIMLCHGSSFRQFVCFVKSRLIVVTHCYSLPFPCSLLHSIGA